MIDEKERESILELAFAGMLHDIGKFMERGIKNKEKMEGVHDTSKYYALVWKRNYTHAAYTAEFFRKHLRDYKNVDINRIELLAAKHHKAVSSSKKSYEYIIHNADCLSAGMDRVKLRKGISTKEYCKVYSRSIYDFVEIFSKFDDKNYFKLVNVLKNNEKHTIKEIDRTYINGMDLTEEYKILFDIFIDELIGLKSIRNKNMFFTQLNHLMHNYTANIPSAVNRQPDISLYDHSRTTAAIATVLRDASDLVILEIAVSGIQKFIYGIADGDDKKGVAKKLRGRSFFVSMIPEIISKYIISELGLTSANILYCGGGKAQIMISLKHKRRVEKCIEKKVMAWIKHEYNGSLAVVFGYVVKNIENDKKYKIKTYELEDYGEMIFDLKHEMELNKKNKYKSIIAKETGFFDIKMTDIIDICKSCNSSIITEETKEKENLICDICNEHKEIGEKLHRTKYLLFVKKNIDNSFKNKNNYMKIEYGDFGCVYMLESEVDDLEEIIEKEEVLDIVRIWNGNSTKNDRSKAESKIKGFKFLANSRPVDLLSGDTLDFEEVANLATGDKKLGVLKMDIDNMGMIMSEGLRTDEAGRENQKSISRIYTLSRVTEYFMTVIINDTCKKVSESYHEKEKVKGLFHTIYSGGDDLFIVGPWDYTITLAAAIREAFKMFTGYNPNMDMSAGLIFVKPKFPIAAAAEMVNEAMENAKKEKSEQKRGVINIFGENLSWDRDENSLLELIKKADNDYLTKMDKISRGVIFKLYELEKQIKDCTDEKKRKLEAEKAYKGIYKIFRTVKDKEIANEVLNDFKASGKFNFLGNYILGKTRGGD